MTETEIQVRLASVHVGVWLTAIVSVGCIVFALATWDQEHRDLLVLMSCLGLLTAPLASALPLERIVRSPRRELFFAGWSLTYVALIGLCAALDGGPESPFGLLLVLPFLFAVLTYPLRTIVLVGLADIATFIALAVGADAGFMYSGFGAFALICVAILGFWDSRNKTVRRRELADTVEALRDSEATSGRQASQQREVARYGAMALGGASIEDLQQRAVDLLERELGADVAAVMRRFPGRDEFRVVSQVGLPEEVAFDAEIRGGVKSQAGYTVTTGTPVVVTDWRHEERFEQSPVLKAENMTSGATVLVKVEGEPWGVLGMQTRAPRRFTREDVNFMQALANILANAIERSTAEERTRHEALHDPLTGLPNRNLFLDRLEHALAHARRDHREIAVLFLDLDQFKLVNDSLGHAAGDELLSAVAPRLEQALRPGDTVARFGGDEFAVLAEDISTERDAIRVAERISEALTRPFVLRERDHFASASIGISIATGTEEPEALIRDADAALYRAKERGRGGYEIFDEVMRSRVIDHMQTENDLRRALQRRELELHYQPIHSLADNSIVMLEALIRWNHPERGVLGPAAFVPVAEESLLIVPIGRWVIEEACRHAAAWQKLDPDAPPVGVAVNISAPQLADPQLAHCVNSAIKRSGIDPGTLRLELTETTLLEEAEEPEVGLAALKALGVRLVLDDFGTGFSSLGYLERLPLSGVKLDRAFIENLTKSGGDAPIIKAVTEMAAALGLDVCAEGVETAEQLDAVRELGCSHAQGFFFAGPARIDEVQDRLRAARIGSP